MIKKYMLVIASLLLGLGLCGCVRHVAEQDLIPTAEKTSYVMKTPAPVKEKPLPSWWAVCEDIYTSDRVESIPLGIFDPQELVDRLTEVLEIDSENAEDTMIAWRCLTGSLMACNASRYANCDEQLDSSFDPNDAMIEACARPDNEGLTLPTAVTGRNNIFEWKCVDGKPEISEQVILPDAANYNSNIWLEIPRPW